MEKLEPLYRPGIRGHCKRTRKTPWKVQSCVEALNPGTLQHHGERRGKVGTAVEARNPGTLQKNTGSAVETSCGKDTDDCRGPEFGGIL